MKVLLAHTQKPPSETRIFEKLALSLYPIPNIELRILGCHPIGEASLLERIEMLAVFSFGRDLISRFQKQLTFWKQAKQFLPDVLIICSSELLIVAILYKLAYRARLIYDVQENLVLNLKFQKAYSGFLFRFLSMVADRLQFFIFHFVDRFWLAEKVYANQLAIKAKDILVLENRVPRTWLEKSKDLISLSKAKNDLDPNLFLFSGVVTLESGVLRAVEFFCKFRRQFPSSVFKISGFVPDIELRKLLKAIELQELGVVLENGGEWSSSDIIFNSLIKADAVFLCYTESYANLEKVPTKFFEALFAGKPVILQKGSHFSELTKFYHAGFELDFDSADLPEILFLKDQISGFVPQTKFSSEFVFESDLLRTDFLDFCSRFSLKF